MIWFLPVLSGLMLGTGWPETGSMTPLVFVGLVPLLFAEHLWTLRQADKLKLKVFAAAYISFFLFNTITTWWIYYASPPGMVMAEVLNSFFMALIFLLFHLTKIKVGEKPAYLALVIFWLAFEWVHYNWELSWVWLTFGNVFANDTTWIQWYEYTGVLGGSLWILAVNLMVFMLVRRSAERAFTTRRIVLQVLLIAMTLIIPILVSVNMYQNYREEHRPVEIVIVQPNIDPYKEKFSGMAESVQIDLLASLGEAKTDAGTDFLVCPETAFPMGYWEHELEYTYGLERMRELLEKYPNLRIVTGLSTMRMYAPGEVYSSTARTFRDGTGNHYDYYNTAMQLDSGRQIQLYHKSKLVLGVEKMPFGSLLKPLEELSIKLGGASGSLGYEKEAINFIPTSPGTAQEVLAPVICYESVYGEYITDYVQKGAEMIFIITNDGWWEDTPGYRQHLAYGRLRAIETRRSIARSANTGISAFIDQRGDVFQATEWWTRVAIKGTINASDKLTFYSKNGDYIGRVAAFFSLLLIVLIIVNSLNKKNRQVI